MSLGQGEKTFQGNLEMLLICLMGSSKASEFYFYFLPLMFGSLKDVPVFTWMQKWVCELHFFAFTRNAIKLQT